MECVSGYMKPIHAHPSSGIFLVDSATRELALDLEERSSELAGHSNRMIELCRVLGAAHGLGAGELRVFCETAPLHDVGKLAIPAEILDREGPLTDEEFEVVKLHTVVGARMLLGSRSELCRTASLIALTHHERWDGSGYPYGLVGQAIPEFSRLVSLVDQYDALRSSRSYKAAFDHDRTCSILLSGDDRTRPEHFDPAVLRSFESVEGTFADRFDELEAADSSVRTVAA